MVLLGPNVPMKVYSLAGGMCPCEDHYVTGCSCSSLAIGILHDIVRSDLGTRLYSSMSHACCIRGDIREHGSHDHGMHELLSRTALVLLLS